MVSSIKRFFIPGSRNCGKCVMCNINAVIIISFNHFETRNLKDVSRLLSKKYIWNIFGASFFYNKRGQNVLLYFLILWFWRFATQITFIARELGHLIRNFAVIGPLTIYSYSYWLKNDTWVKFATSELAMSWEKSRVEWMFESVPRGHVIQARATW